ncbi:ROK family protein [Parablautia muri]|nr:ROK family protein [Parablautia muri]
MNNSADIRKENKKTIYRLMLGGGTYTKQQVAIGTGLSVATCNTLLNDMQRQGIILGGDKLPGEVGRSSILYRIREDHESYLAVHFYMEQGRRFIETLVFSAVGRIIFREKQMPEYVDYEEIEKVIAKSVGQIPNITRIVVGTPSIAENGIIRHCDIPELENTPLKEKLEDRFHINVLIENDMHHKAYGYYMKHDDQDAVITLAYFPEHILPGTVTIHKGTIIKGANCFAGMTGFLPYNISRKELLTMLEPERCMPFIAQSLSAIIVLLNPGLIVLTGSLISPGMLECIKKKCGESIPPEYMPKFKAVDSFDEFYVEGMYQLAVDRKEI